MSFRDLEEGIGALFDEAAIAGTRKWRFDEDVSTRPHLSAQLYFKAAHHTYKNDYRRRITAELRSKRLGKRIPPADVERGVCRHCGAPTTRVLSGRGMGRIYHSGTRDSIEAPCEPLIVPAAA